MNRNNTWRLLIVVLVVAWSLFELYPPTGRDLLQEFKGKSVSRDTNYNTILATAEALQKERPASSFRNLRQAIGTNDITRYFPGIKVLNQTDPTKFVLNRLQQDAAGKIKLGLDLQGGSSFLVGVDTTKVLSDTNLTRITAEDTQQRALEQAVEVLRKRVDKFGVSEPLIQPVGNNKILIQMPGLSESDKDAVRNTLQKAAFLEFRMVHSESDNLISQGLGAPGYEKLSIKQKRGTGPEIVRLVLVKKKPERGLTGKFVEKAYVSRDPVSNRPTIGLNFNSEGARLFAEVTKEHVGHQLGIVLDGELYSAPNINEPINGGSASISGDFDLKEAFELQNVLSNPLEAPVKIMEERGVEASLGKAAVDSGIKAAVYGTIAVAAFMIVYYMLAGLVADAALILNIVILLGVMCSVGTTLTLPGIAGIVLTIGMSVDANVLIFERIREESQKGKSLRGAISAGYDRAFSTIFDSHVTTLISSIILIFMGTGSIRGFGITLTIGVSASLFTALVVTRLIFDFILKRDLIKALPMLHMIRATNIDFMKIAKPAFIATWAVILIGISYGIFSRGEKLLGVDFRGGDSLTLGYVQKVDQTLLVETLKKAGLTEPVPQYQPDFSGGPDTLRITSEFGTGDKVEKALQQAFPQSKFTRAGLDKVGASVGAEIQKAAIIASLLSLFGILVYVAFRYEFSFAVGAVLAVIHDVLMTIGCYCLSGREFNAPVVAAILTIIGFSINDTIVIFDRIREDLKLGIRGSFKDIINQALNQTLSRTLITSGTVFLATSALFIFGGGGINDFAFTFLIGIVTGTYSSIYIASALVLWWHKGQRPLTTMARADLDPSQVAKAI